MTTTDPTDLVRDRIAATHSRHLDAYLARVTEDAGAVDPSLRPGYRLRPEDDAHARVETLWCVIDSLPNVLTLPWLMSRARDAASCSPRSCGLWAISCSAA